MPKESSNPQVNWKLYSFNELSLAQLYNVLKLRQEIFVVEQDCPYMDCDDYDQESLHLMAMVDGGLAGYARILPAGLYYKEPSIGRIVTAADFRRMGLGKRIIAKGLEIMEDRFGKTPIRIMAQCYLIKFYEAFGFATVGEEFLEDGIPHIEMFRN